MLGAEYLPGQNNKFITYGKGHVIFWEQDGNKLIKKSGLFEVSSLYTFHPIKSENFLIFDI